MKWLCKVTILKVLSGSMKRVYNQGTTSFFQFPVKGSIMGYFWGTTIVPVPWW